MSSRTPNGMDKLGLKNIREVYYNLSYDALEEHEVKAGECKVSTSGASMCDTGIFTGRSPKDKYFVNQTPSNENISWGAVNKKIDKEIYEELLDLTLTQLSGKKYLCDGCLCWSE
jgi:phosphoenolpyruvate carboxykinase (ATP)